MGGGVEAELSAGHHIFVDGADFVTAQNLVMRLFFGSTDVATRLMRLDCLPGCPDAAAEAARGGPNARTPLQRAADQQAYKRLAAIFRYAELWGFSKDNLCAIATQALHLAETKQYATVASVDIAASSAWTMHTVSATNVGVQTTSAAYAKSVKLFCQFAAEPDSQQPGGVVVPVNRYVVVTLLRSEQARPKRTGVRPSAVDDDESGTDSESERLGVVVDDDGDEEEDRMEEGGRGGGGNVPGGSCGRARVVNGGARPGDHPPAHSRSPTGEADTQPPTSADGNTTMAPSMTVPRVRTIGQTVVKMHQSALAKVGLIFNQLWTAWGCADCAFYDVESHASVGTYGAANVLVSETQRNRTLENTSSGVAKATGLRDPTLPDKDRRALIETMLLRPTTSKQMQKALLLAGLFVLSFSLEARGATTRGLEWSDHAVRRFPAMFGTGGDDVDALCTYVSATKTGEGGDYCLGSISHVDPWMCPLGAVADALVEDCHREGQDLLRPPVSFSPDFNPTDAAMRATGVEPKYFWASASEMGWSPWYQWRQLQAMRGVPYKAMSYDFHRGNLRKAAGGADINLRAVSTHAFRKAAAQKGKESGVSVGDDQCHGMWNLGAADGAYDGLIPNAPMMTALSGRSADCSSPVTPRLSVEVSDALQSTVCPWLADEEAKCTARVARDYRCQDQALLDFLSLVRMSHSVFFQTWAARVVTTSLPPDAEILRHPLLNNDHFRNLCGTMTKVLDDSGRAVEAAVSQVLPQLSHAVKVAVEAVAAASSSCVVDVERRLSIQMDDAVADLKALSDVGFSAMMELLGSTAAEVRSLRVEVAYLRAFSKASSAGAVSGITGGDSHWGGGAESLACPAPTTAVVQRPPVVPPPAVAPPPVAISSRLAQDRENVRQLAMRHKLEGVPIFSGNGQYVPLLPLVVDLGWEAALTKYAKGFMGRGVANRRASIREGETMFGERWRSCIPDTADRRRLGKLYSARSPICRAFQREYDKRGAALGVEQVVSFLKAKYKGKGGAVAATARLPLPPRGPAAAMVLPVTGTVAGRKRAGMVSIVHRMLREAARAGVRVYMDRLVVVVHRVAGCAAHMEEGATPPLRVLFANGVKVATGRLFLNMGKPNIIALGATSEPLASGSADSVRRVDAAMVLGGTKTYCFWPRAWWLADLGLTTGRAIADTPAVVRPRYHDGPMRCADPANVTTCRGGLLISYSFDDTTGTAGGFHATSRVDAPNSPRSGAEPTTVLVANSTVPRHRLVLSAIHDGLRAAHAPVLDALGVSPSVITRPYVCIVAAWFDNGLHIHWPVPRLSPFAPTELLARPVPELNVHLVNKA